MKHTLLIAACAILLGLSACKKDEEGPTLMVNDEVQNAGDTIGKGTFTGYAHSLSGKAILYKETDGDTILRFESFNMTPGPDVHVYLSKTASFSSGSTIEVAALSSGYTNSAVNFGVNINGYTADHKYVLVYCYQFSELFGNTTLE
jgi:hypothetical protein